MYVCMYVCMYVHAIVSSSAACEEDIGFRRQTLPKLGATDFERPALKEREHWRRLGLKNGLAEPDLPSCLRKVARSGATSEWLMLPEAFGDFLCESAQVLRQLLGVVKLRATNASGCSAPALANISDVGALREAAGEPRGRPPKKICFHSLCR